MNKQTNKQNKKPKTNNKKSHIKSEKKRKRTDFETYLCAHMPPTHKGNTNSFLL